MPSLVILSFVALLMGGVSYIILYVGAREKNLPPGM